MSARAQSADDLARKAQIEALSVAPLPEQLERKARSLARLHEMNVPVLDSLPVIAPEAQTLRRSDHEVAGRALALMIVALKGETGDQELTLQVIDQYAAQAYFTPGERAFIADPAPSEQIRIEMTWRYEAAYTLLWALGFFDDLSPPDRIVDAAVLGTLFRELGVEAYLQEARLRPQAELLDMTDLTYRLDWAAVNARVNGKAPPAALHPGIVYERHYALNWLYGYAGLGWDEMRTDT